jgi:hypothetical protein
VSRSTRDVRSRVQRLGHVLHGNRLHPPEFRKDPQFKNRRDDPHDFGVVVFDQPIPGITPAMLPSEELLDTLGPQGLQDEVFPVVGYGISNLLGGANGGGSPRPDRSSAGTRKTGTGGSCL